MTDDSRPWMHEVDLLTAHGWEVVGLKEYPVTLVRRRYRLMGRELMISIQAPEPDRPEGALPWARLSGIGWTVRTERDLLGWVTWPPRRQVVAAVFRCVWWVLALEAAAFLALAVLSWLNGRTHAGYGHLLMAAALIVILTVSLASQRLAGRWRRRKGRRS